MPLGDLSCCVIYGPSKRHLLGFPEIIAGHSEGSLILNFP